jgi:DNA-binding response OmpR family regulator
LVATLRGMNAVSHRVLVVEDDPVVRGTLELVLAGEGFDVELAASGREAIDLCRAERFALVVLDYWLPGPSGLELVRWLRAEGNRVPCVIFTSCLEPGVRATGHALGVSVIDRLNWRELVAVAASLTTATPAAA